MPQQRAAQLQAVGRRLWRFGASGQPALLNVEVLDESGAPQPFDPDQAGEIDQLLDLTAPGMPSLPPGFTLSDPPRVDMGGLTPMDPSTKNTNSGCGCSVRASNNRGPRGLGLAAFGLLVLVGRRARQ